MLSLYTDEVKRFIFTRDWPKGLVMDIREAYEPEPHLNLIFFRDNWLTFDFDDQQKVTTIVKEVMAKLWADGVPTYVGKMEKAHG